MVIFLRGALRRNGHRSGSATALTKMYGTLLLNPQRVISWFWSAELGGAARGSCKRGKSPNEERARPSRILRTNYQTSNMFDGPIQFLPLLCVRTK